MLFKWAVNEAKLNRAILLTEKGKLTDAEYEAKVKALYISFAGKVVEVTVAPKPQVIKEEIVEDPAMIEVKSKKTKKAKIEE